MKASDRLPRPSFFAEELSQSNERCGIATLGLRDLGRLVIVAAIVLIFAGLEKEAKMKMAGIERESRSSKNNFGSESKGSPERTIARFPHLLRGPALGNRTPSLL